MAPASRPFLPGVSTLFRRRRARRFAAIVGAGGVLLAPGVAHPATRTATSAATGMTATLDGAVLTVAPGPRVSSSYLGLVQGRDVSVACVSGAEDLIALVEEEALVPTRSFDFSVLGGPAVWPAASPSFAYTLPRDVSDRVDGCLVGRNAELAATFGFTPTSDALFDESLPLQRLAMAHRAAKMIARARPDRRFPTARRLARAVAVAEPQMRVEFARDVRAARRNDVVYVIGSRTTFKRVVLAYRRNDGQPVLLEGRRRGAPEITEPDGELQVPETEGNERRSRRGR